MKAINNKIDSFAKLQARNLPERKKRVLCSYIEKIQNKANELQLNLAPESANYERATEIYKLAKLVQEQALAMEKRLYLYKETIEALGFKRVRGK